MKTKLLALNLNSLSKKTQVADKKVPNLRLAKSEKEESRVHRDEHFSGRRKAEEGVSLQTRSMLFFVLCATGHAREIMETGRFTEVEHPGNKQINMVLLPAETLASGSMIYLKAKGVDGDNKGNQGHGCAKYGICDSSFVEVAMQTWNRHFVSVAKRVVERRSSMHKTDTLHTLICLANLSHPMQRWELLANIMFNKISIHHENHSQILSNCKLAEPWDLCYAGRLRIFGKRSKGRRYTRSSGQHQ